MTTSNPPRTLLDWIASHARDLEAMRANTARWVRKGIIARPGNVRIRAAMSANPGAKVRKAHAG